MKGVKKTRREKADIFVYHGVWGMMTLAECVRSHAEIKLITNDWPRKKGDLGIIDEQSVRADSTLTPTVCALTGL